ncbi:TPA: hypothetical protein ACKFUK_000139 [Citrobacter amalonaticus]
MYFLSRSGDIIGLRQQDEITHFFEIKTSIKHSIIHRHDISTGCEKILDNASPFFAVVHKTAIVLLPQPPHGTDIDIDI